MKSFFIFLGGFICGAILLFIVGKTTSLLTDKPKDLVMFEKDGECFDTDKLVIFQALETGVALAQFGGLPDDEDDRVGSKFLSNIVRNIAGTTVLLLDEKNNKSFYDGEVVSIPKDMCAKQVGTYRYETQDATFITVPVVVIK